MSSARATQVVDGIRLGDRNCPGKVRTIHILIDLDAIDRMREHSDRKARAAVPDMLGEQIAASFVTPTEAARSRQVGLADDEVKAVGVRVMVAPSFGDLFTAGGSSALRPVDGRELRTARPAP